MAGRKYRANVFEIATRAFVNDTDARTPTISDVTGLQSALDGKQNVLTGFTGIIDIVVSVDFKKQISSTAKINVSNGIIISIN